MTIKMTAQKTAQNRRSRICGVAVVACVFGFAVLGWAAKDFVMPEPLPAASYPAHDVHDDEAVAVALDPYDTPEKARIFNVDYEQIGFLPVYVVITNNSNQPISLESARAELVTAGRVKIPPATVDDIFRRLAHPAPNPAAPRFPWPSKKGGVNKQAREEVIDSRFAARAVEPHATHSGFMFFDISGLSDPLANAHFYWTGVQNANGKELMYFDVELQKGLGTPQK